MKPRRAAKWRDLVTYAGPIQVAFPYLLDYLSVPDATILQLEASKLILGHYQARR
jgi:hypothetical protein